MKIRTLIICILGIVIVSSVSPAQNAGTLEPVSSFEAQAEPSPRSLFPGSPHQNATPVARTPAPETPTKLRIFELKYAKAENLAALIGNLFRMQVQTDYRLNRLIINATQEQVEGIESLIEAMDVADSEASTPREIENLVYRIYMFEIPSGDKGMRSFSMILQTSARVSSKELSVAAADNDFQISEFLQINNGLSEPQAEILIQGKAASDEAFKRFFEKFPESHIMELKWDDDETFTDNIAAAQYTQLPEQMQKHIRKFLGDEIRTVGYWFGNSSVPGKVEAPIGPWTLSLRLDTESDRTLELNVDVEVPGEMHRFDSRLGRERNDEILSNTIRAKIGKPVIIGYNRESYGTRKMGAMVIIPEADPVQSDATTTNPNRF